MALPTLSVVDYILLIVLLLSSAVIGVVFGFFKSKKSSAKEFLLGMNLISSFYKIYKSSFFSIIADGGMGVSS
jgi:type II secretory pathway component PulF